MPLPRSFLSLVKSTRFWSDYLFLTDTPYPSPYKAAFQLAHDGSEDELESDNQDSDQESESHENPDHQSESGSSNEPASDEPRPEASAEATSDEDDDEASPSSSSSSSNRRPHSPFYSHNLIFPFHRATDLGDETSLNLRISLSPNLSYFELTFCTADVYDIAIAQHDQAHWHPFVLRWEELEAICRAVGITYSQEEEEGDTGTDGGWEHPGLPLLFLYRFAPICRGDHVDRIVAMLVRAWKRVLGEEVSDRDVRRFVERMDCRDRGFRWFNEGENWWIGQGEDAETAEAVYTYRSREAVQSGKWRNKEWNDLVGEARAIAEAAGGVEGLSEEDRELAARFAPRRRYGLSVWLALREKDRPLHQRAGRYFCLTLDGVLRILDMGRASSSGASSCIINGQSVWTSDHSSVSIHGDLARGRAVIKQMLWWLRAPLATTFRSESTYNELPFNLADDDSEDSSTDEAYLGICVPAILPDCSWLVGHTLPDSLQAVLGSKEVLGDTGQLSGPTSDGWLTATTTDGGELGFNFSRFDGEEAEGTGALALRKVTSQASDILHRLMNVSRAVLAPVALTARPLEENIAEMSWVPHRVVDAKTLHQILSDGAFELWVKADRKVDALDDSDEEPSTPQW